MGDMRHWLFSILPLSPSCQAGVTSLCQKILFHKSYVMQTSKVSRIYLKWGALNKDALMREILQFMVDVCNSISIIVQT